MRRLIAWIYAAWFGLQVKSHDQHVGDLENMLSELLEAQRALDDEVAACVRQLLAAQEARDRINQRRGEYIDTARPADMVDRRFPDVVPRSY